MCTGAITQHHAPFNTPPLQVVMHDLAAAAGAPLTPRTQALDAQLRHAHALLAAWERAHASMRRTLQEREGTLSEAKARIRQLQKELTQVRCTGYDDEEGEDS